MNGTVFILEKNQYEIEVEFNNWGQICWNFLPFFFFFKEPTANKSLEKAEGAEKQKEEIDSMSKDTTSQHRQHLFDLNCKICIGNWKFFILKCCFRFGREILVFVI